MLDFGVIAAAWLLGYLAGFAGAAPFGVRGMIPYLLIPVVTQLFFNQVIGLYGPVWRYASVEEAVRVVAAVVVGTLVATLEVAWLADVRGTTLPLLSAPPTAALLILLGCGGIRFQARLFALERQRDGRRVRLRTLIVGATDEGLTLALELGRRTYADGVIVGFVDDHQDFVGRTLCGRRVLGTTDDLERLCVSENIDRILIALPDAPRERLRAIVARALTTDAQVKLLSDSPHTPGGPLLNSLRDLDLTDLLGREHAPVDTTDIADYLTGATVLVTGAGGSIGSEIARQVVRYGPAQLLLLDRDESLLFETISTLDKAEPVLADIRDEKRLREIFEHYEPDVVFHAAAHKHVPILETHAGEAVQNNVLATLTLARTAAEHHSRLVHISTDKAADPCSVMGATKRAAELVVLAVGHENHLPFAAVRFGNVLGSRGSVVPTFFRQIVEGGPVTVTDPEMTRYFMTIPEAVSLVLQAGAMADDRKVFVLEMGNPVRIIELARQMIRLAGLRPGEDIKIEIVGTRPGERLHEQLHDGAETVEPTRHPSIRSLTPCEAVDGATIFSFLEQLRRQCAEAHDRAAAGMLEQMLRECGVPCHLDEGIQNEELDAEIDLTPAEPVVHRRVRRGALPALLGGDPAFSLPLPFARPLRPEIDRVMRRLAPSYDRGILTNGPLVAELEARTAERLDVRHVVAVNSCTSGLMLSVQALARDHSGPVVVPSFTFSASAHAIAWNSRTPRFVECLPDTFQIDPIAAAHALDGASALIATHVFGAPCDPARIDEIACAHGVPLIFDAAHAFGARADGVPIGAFGTAEVFSLTPTKVLVAGEGGLIATRDAALAEELRIGRDYGNPGDYDTQFAGLNARMSEFHAAMALESLELLDESLDRRRHLAALYRSSLAGLPGIGFQAVPARDESTYKDFTITVDPSCFGLTRDALALALAAEGIDTRKYFAPPVHRQRAYRHLPNSCLPVTDAVSRSVLSLPIFPALRDQDVEQVAETLATMRTHAVEVDAFLATMDVADDLELELGSRSFD